MASYEKTYNNGRRNRPAPLPAGGYVARVTESKKAFTSKGYPYIRITVEIIEGNYIGWFRNDYIARLGGQYQPKHRGYFRLWLPRNDGSEGEDWRVTKLAHNVECILGKEKAAQWTPEHPEELIGHDVGIVTRIAEFNGHPYAEIGKLVMPKSAREGNFEPLEKRICHQDDNPPQPQNQPGTIPPGFTEANDEELPF